MKEEKKQSLERTKEFWQPYTRRVLTDEDARQITENIVGFFQILQEWEKKERDKRDKFLDKAHHY